MTGAIPTTRTPDPGPSDLEDHGPPGSVSEPRCGQCGRPSDIGRLFCQECGSLLPDPGKGRVFTYSGCPEEAGKKRTWLWVSVATILLISVSAAVALVVYRATQPEPEEQLAEESSQRALTIFKSLRKAKTLRAARATSVAGESARIPVASMLSRLGSANETRPRLDAYRSLFRGVASLTRVRRDQLQEWDRTKQLISASLSGLASVDPLTGMLTSQGRMAIDAVQDLVDELERTRRVTETTRTVGARSRILVSPQFDRESHHKLYVDSPLSLENTE